MKREPAVLLVIFIGGIVFGFGLGYSHMARPEVVLDFLTFDDFGLLFVMIGGATVAGFGFWILPFFRESAPLTDRKYSRRLKSLDHEVLIGGSIFGIG